MPQPWFPQVEGKSGNFLFYLKIFQGQGIVKEFEKLRKYQDIAREFYIYFSKISLHFKCQTCFLFWPTLAAPNKTEF